MRPILVIFLILGTACIIILSSGHSTPAATTQPSKSNARDSDRNCGPTPADYLGPYYESGAPVRSSVGNGYLLEGTVMSTIGCSPIAKARIELWLTNPAGTYDDAHRATIFSDETGEYSFESNFPPGYSGRPPHIHIRISADGFKTLVTQHYPGRSDSTGSFDIVLVPLD